MIDFLHGFGVCISASACTAVARGARMSDHQSLWGLGLKEKQKFENIINFFLGEPGADKTASMQKTLQATGVGRTIVYKIRKRAKQAGTFSSQQWPRNANLIRI